MGELAPVILGMLDSGQIVCEYVRRQRKQELVFAARATPDDVRALLPLVKHPVPCGLLRYFLEGLLYISAVTEPSSELKFCASEAFRDGSDSQAGSRIFGSGVEDPPGLEDAAKQAVSERAVADCLGIPFRPNANGWLELYIGGRSVEIRHVEGDDPLACRCGTGAGKELVIVVRLESAERSAKVIGWTTRAQIDESSGKSEQCLIEQTQLLPTEDIKRLAREAGVGYAQ